jgi:general secretion pathway protein A
MAATVVVTVGVVSVAVQGDRLARNLGWRRADVLTAAATPPFPTPIAVAGPREPAAPAASSDARHHAPTAAASADPRSPAPMPAASADTQRPVSTPAVAVATDTPEPTLARVLQQRPPTAGRAAAFARLYALWGVQAPEDRLASPCAPGSSALACLSGRGTWRVLTRLDVPAVIELVDPAGVKRHAVVTAIDGERVTLEIGREPHVVTLAEVERFWDGAFTVLWRRPAVSPIPLELWMRGRSVVWLREQLGKIDGHAAPARASEVYDADLRRRVMDFQRGQSLIADGLVGEETLLRIAAMADSRMPSLARRRPGA